MNRKKQPNRSSANIGTGQSLLNQLPANEEDNFQIQDDVKNKMSDQKNLDFARLSSSKGDQTINESVDNEYYDNFDDSLLVGNAQRKTTVNLDLNMSNLSNEQRKNLHNLSGFSQGVANITTNSMPHNNQRPSVLSRQQTDSIFKEGNQQSNVLLKNNQKNKNQFNSNMRQKSQDAQDDFAGPQQQNRGQRPGGQNRSTQPNDLEKRRQRPFMDQDASNPRDQSLKKNLGTATQLTSEQELLRQREEYFKNNAQANQPHVEKNQSDESADDGEEEDDFDQNNVTSGLSEGLDMQRLSSGSHEFQRRKNSSNNKNSNSTAMKEGGTKSKRHMKSNNSSPDDSAGNVESHQFGQASNFEIEEGSYKHQKGSGKRNIFGQVKSSRNQQQSQSSQYFEESQDQYKDSKLRKRKGNQSMSNSGNNLDETPEMDKYEKVGLIQDFRKQKAFIYQDLSKLKIFTLVVIFLSALNLLFTILFMQAYKLQHVTSYFFPLSMLYVLLTSVFGQISIIRVEQKHEKYYFSNLSGTFSFEALMMYFRFVMISIPLMIYQVFLLLINVQKYAAQLEGIFNQDDMKHMRWISLFGREYQLQPLQETSRFVVNILAVNTSILCLFQIMILFKQIKVGSDQTKIRLNDFFQVICCIVIPALSSVISLKAVIQLWYFKPYENIFEAVLPQNFCIGVLIVQGGFVVNQMFGARAANVEYSLTVNIYMLLQFALMCAMIAQFVVLFTEFTKFEETFLSDSSEIANFMTYIHQNDFMFIIGGIGSLGTNVGSDIESFSSCPSGKYMDHLSSSNIYELKCPQQDLIRMKWDMDSTDKASALGDNLYACLNIHCQDQFKHWIQSLVQTHLLLNGILILTAMFSIYLAYKMKTRYLDVQSSVMWHDDVSLATTVFILLVILVGSGFYAKFNQNTVKVRKLIKFDHFTEFEKEKLSDSHFQILKQETMRIDQKLMQVDQTQFDILALQINEDDSLCRPECSTLIYNVTISSIYGNVFLNYPSGGDQNFQESENTLVVNQTKNEVGMNLINFAGGLNDANMALKSMEFEPSCPLNQNNYIQLKVLAGAKDGHEASGQLISMAIGLYKEIKGFGQTEIIDTPIYQHLSRSKNTSVIGKVVDSQYQIPIRNITVEAIMTGYSCEHKAVMADLDGIFQFDFPHIRNNYPYTVQFKLNSVDDKYASESKDIIIGGLLRSTHKFVEIPMNLNTNTKALLTYQSYVIDAQQLTPLKQDDVTVYVNKMSSQESSFLLTIFPDNNGLVTIPHSKLMPQYIKTIVQPSGSFLKYSSIDYLASAYMVRPLAIQPSNTESDLTVVLTWITPSPLHGEGSDHRGIQLDLYVDFMVDNFKCSVSSYLPVCQGVALNTKPKNEIVNSLGMDVININSLDQTNYLIYVGQYLDQNHLMSRKEIQESKARIDIYSSSYKPQGEGNAQQSQREGSGQIASIDIPFAQLIQNTNSSSDAQSESLQLIENSKAMYWSAICINGRTTLNDIFAINELTHSRPDVNKVCKSELSQYMRKGDSLDIYSQSNVKKNTTVV